MLELKTRKLEIKFNDKVHTLNFPTVKQMNEYSESYEKNENKIGVISDLLKSLGLEESVCDLLELDHLEKILGALTDTKKS